jgi:hypothetical protein
MKRPIPDAAWLASAGVDCGLIFDSWSEPFVDTERRVEGGTTPSTKGVFAAALFQAARKSTKPSTLIGQYPLAANPVGDATAVATIPLNNFP